MNALSLSDFRFTPANRIEMKTGLLGWIAFTIDGALRVDGVTLRRTTEGRLALSFPAKTSSDGRKRSILWPVSNTARQAIESIVFEYLYLSPEAGQ